MVLPYGSTVQTHTHTHFIHIILSRREVLVAWYGNEKNIKRDGINFSIGSPIMSFPILRPIDDEEDDEKISLRMFQFRRKILISCSEICHVLNSLSLLWVNNNKRFLIWRALLSALPYRHHQHHSIIVYICWRQNSIYCVIFMIEIFLIMWYWS